MPKKLHPVWINFEVSVKPGNKGKWAKCKKCGKELQGIPERLQKHLDSENCQSTTATEPPAAAHSHSDQHPGPSLAKKKRQTTLTETFTVTTTREDGERIDQSVANFFYSTNTPFRHADHKAFKSMCHDMRPGYKPPSAYQLAGPLLEKSYQSSVAEHRKSVDGMTVSMSLDGWSNIRNEPIVCCCINPPDSQPVLVETVDTSGHPHDADYLKNIALQSIRKAEESFGVLVRSFVTDNACNVTKMRRELAETEDVDIIQYGCSAHILNLLAQDVEIQGVTAHILKVVKYFRNTHLPASWYRHANGKKLMLPALVRWNTVRNSLRSYLDNRGIIVQICQNHKNEIDKDVFKIVNDMQITYNAMNLLSRLDPIARALDRAQRDGTTIAVAVEIWHRLSQDLADQPSSVRNSFNRRRDMALGPPHFLANILDHRFGGQNLNTMQRNEAFTELAPFYMPIVTKIMTKSVMFPSYLFETQFRDTNPLEWWKLLDLNTSDSQWQKWDHKDSFMKICTQVLTAVASTAGLERIFSRFGLVHSKLRNRLGVDKAHKLVSIFKTSNKLDLKSKNMKWVWETETEEIDEEEEEMEPQFDEPGPRWRWNTRTVYSENITVDSDSDEDIPLAEYRSGKSGN